MSLTVECPKCFQTYSVPDNLAGKSIRCKSCSAEILVERETLGIQRTESSQPSPTRSQSQPKKKKKKRKKKNLSRISGVSVLSLFGILFSHAAILITVCGLTALALYHEQFSSLAFLYVLIVVVGGIRFRMRRGSDAMTELGMGAAGLIAIGLMVKSGALDTSPVSSRFGFGSGQNQSSPSTPASLQTPGAGAQSKLTLYEPAKGFPRFQISNLRIRNGDRFEFDYKVTSGQAQTHHTVYLLASHLPSAKTISVTTFGHSSGTISGYLWTIGPGSKNVPSLDNGCEVFIAEESPPYLFKLSNSLTRGNMAVTQTLPAPTESTVPSNLVPVPASLTSFSQISQLQINKDGRWVPVKVVSRLNDRFQIVYLNLRRPGQTFNVSRSELYIDKQLLAQLESNNPQAAPNGEAAVQLDLVRVPGSIKSLDNAGAVYVKAKDEFHRVDPKYKIGPQWHIKYLEGPFEGREVDRSEIYIDRKHLAELQKANP